MPTYKVTKVYNVSAASKHEAVARITADPGELLEFVSVIEQPSLKPAGWSTTLIRQLTSSKKGR